VTDEATNLYEISRWLEGAMRLLRLFAVVGLLFAFHNPCAAQESTDVQTMLHDAAYAFNRFEEAARGIDVDSWNIPDSTKKSTRGAAAAILRNVAQEKPHVYALLGRTNIPASDLLQVHMELDEVGAEEDSLASSTGNWGTPSDSIAFAKLAGQTQLLAAKLGVALIKKLVEQEYALAACRQSTTKSPPRK
jgi:hypothetical protein